MIAIAVAASLVAYAWMMGYIGGTTTKAGKAILIQSMAPAEDGNLLVYVQNVGQGSVTISSVYVDDVLRSFTPDPNFADNKLPEGKTASLKVNFVVPDSGQVKVKVITTEGTFTESTAISSGQGSSGSLNIIPTAAFTYTPTYLAVSFDGSTSSDTDGTIISYAWTFGDSGTGSGATPPHTYASAGTYTVTLTVTDDDGATDDEVKSVTVSAAPPGNTAPVLGAIGPQSVDELSTLTFTATATDGDLPPQTLTYSLDSGAPAGASIDASSGVFTWTPTEAQGPDSYPITVRVTDNGSPALDDYETITVTVGEVNVAPVLSGVPSTTVTVDEGATVTFDADANDADLPAQTLTFSLSGAPAAASIDPSTGAFSWVTAEADGPGDYTFSVRVADGVATTSASVTVRVNEVSLPAIYVTSSGNAHAPPEIGTLSNFANMQNDDGSYATLTEANVAGASSWTTPTAINSKCGESQTGWNPAVWRYATYTIDGNTGTYWRHDSDHQHWIVFDMGQSVTVSQVRIYQASGSDDRWPTGDGSDTVDVYVSDNPTSWGTVDLDNWDANNGDQWQTSGTFSATGRYIILQATGSSGNAEDSRMYEFQAMVTPSPNYQLDLEVQFPAGIDSAYTRLEIKTGAFSGEGIEVQRWDGSAWVSIGTLTASSENIFTGISLTDDTLHLRFIDATRTSDTTPNTWQIDYVRLVAP